MHALLLASAVCVLAARPAPTTVSAPVERGPVDVAQAAAPAAAAESPTRLFLLDLRTASVDQTVVRSLSGILAAELSRYPELDVLSGEDVRRTVELEADRSALGCDTQSASCLAEIANAMGAELVVFGDVDQIEGTFTMNLNLLDTTSVRSKGRVAVQAKGFEDLATQARASLRELLGGVYAARGWTLPAEAPAAAPPTRGPPVLAFATLGAGALSLASGVVLGVVGLSPLWSLNDAADRIVALEAEGTASSLEAAKPLQQDLDRHRGDWTGWGAFVAASGGALVVVGGAAVAAGALWATAPVEE